MKSYFFSALSVAALLVASVSAQLTIDTPSNVLECSPLRMTFTGGSPPYIISVYPGATPSTGTPLVSFTNITGSPYVWAAVNYPEGTSLGLTLRDNTGLQAQSAAFTVLAGATTSCTNGTASGSNAGTNTPAATAPTNTAATTTGTTPAQSKASGATGSSTSKAPSSSSSSSDAIVAGIPYGVAGVLGAAVAALFV